MSPPQDINSETEFFEGMKFCDVCKTYTPVFYGFLIVKDNLQPPLEPKIDFCKNCMGSLIFFLDDKIKFHAEHSEHKCIP